MQYKYIFWNKYHALSFSCHKYNSLHFCTLIFLSIFNDSFSEIMRNKVPFIIWVFNLVRKLT